MARPRKNPEPKPEIITIECLVHNIFTHDRHIFRGETAQIPADDLPIYQGRVRVV